jgi:hypothetical protein
MSSALLAVWNKPVLALQGASEGYGLAPSVDAWHPPVLEAVQVDLEIRLSWV